MSFWKKFFTLSISLLLPFVVVTTVYAQDTSTPKEVRVVLEKEQIITNDYFAAGNTVDLNGTVRGDTYIAGGTVNIDGTITGDLLVAGGTVNINGDVAQNVRVVGGDVRIRGRVGKNISAVGGTITLEKAASLNGNLVVAGGTVQVLSTVKNLTVASGKVRIESEVSGNTTAAVGNMELSENAVLVGNLEYWSQERAQITRGAKIIGKTAFHQTEIKKEDQKKIEKVASGADIGLKVISFLSTLVLGLVLLKLIPVYSEKTADIVTSRFWMNILVGFLTLILAPVIFFLLLITLIGIPYAFVLLAGFLIILYFSKVFVMLAIGKKVLSFVGKKNTLYTTFVVGLLSYYIIGFVPVLGGLVGFIVMLLGVGAMLFQKKYYYKFLKEKKMV